MAYKGKRINPKKFEPSQIKIMLIILPLVIFMGMPIIFITNHAFKPMEELFAFPPTFFVKNATFENFTKLMKFSSTSGIPLSRYIFNSLIVTVLTVGLSLLLTTLSAFALAKIKFKGRNLLVQINQIAIMFVATAVLIPRYLVICKLGLIDHVLPLVAMPVALFLVKQFVEQVPDSLLEAAYMDGATDFQVYLKVILPMIKPAIATASILVFQQVWTNMETSNYFFNDDSLKTLTFYMNTLVNANNSVAGQGMSAAASLIMFLPNLLLFIILQNKVMNTMASSGIK